MVPAPDALLKVLQALKTEREVADRTPRIPYDWADYRRHQEMWNRNYAPACELEPLH